MHKEILANNQKEIMPLLIEFSEDFGMVGGTAVALQIGHRQSIDFDLFSIKPFENKKVRNIIAQKGNIEKVIRDEKDQYEIIFKGVRLTFLYYPFPISFLVNMDNIIKLPDLLTLAAMKAYALGRRAKWKDYVDLFFILNTHYSVSEISKKGEEIFSDEFNEKNFRMQLAYHKDIDFSEKVIFMPGFETNDIEIKEKLIKFSLS